MGTALKRRMILAVILVCLAFLIPQTCLAANLLANPGFEEGYDLMAGCCGASGVTHGWTAVLPGNGSYSVEEIHYGGDARFHSGANAMSHSTETMGESISKQTVWVVPGASYTASVYVKGWDYSGDATGFGADGTTDSAGLKIRELDYLGNVVVDHTELTITDPLDYTLLTETFQAGANTYKVEFSLHTLIQCHWSKGRTSFDDAVLDGPAGVAPTASVTGVVSLGGSPVSGATVTAGGKTSVTGTDGVYSITGVPISDALGTQVNVQYTGYVSENKYPVLVIGSNTVNFALMAPPTNNRLVNGDFELGGPYGSAGGGAGGIDSGWSFALWGDCGSYLRRESLVNKDGPEPAGVAFPWQPHSGNEASRHCTSGHGFNLAYQDILVVPSSLYKASVWVKARNFDALGFGVTGSGDYAALHIQEFAGSDFLLDHSLQSITAATDWTKLSEEFTTQPTTTKVRYFLETMIGGLWSGCGHWQHGQVVYDDAVLDGATVTATISGTVNADGLPLAGATVTAAGKSATSGSDGSYTITGIVLTSDKVQIVASCPGYYPENKFRVLEQQVVNTVDFNLYALPTEQLLTNGEFENPGAPYIAAGNSGSPQSSSGWTCRLWSTGSAYLRRESTVFQYNGGYEPDGVGPGPWEPYSGTQCSRHTANPGGQHEISQTVVVMPLMPYKASVMAKRVNLAEGDSVGLHIQELNSVGTVIVDHTPVAMNTGATEWTRLSDDFTTSESTDKVKYMLETSDSVHWSIGWANYDNAVLDGKTGVVPTGTVTGTVRLGTSPVSGATVTVGGKTATSGSNGVYSIADVVITDQLSRINVQLAGYVSENKWRLLTIGTNTIDFDLVALPARNLLANSDFEELQGPYVGATNGGVGVDQSWTFECWAGQQQASFLRRESSFYKDAGEPQGLGNGPWTPHSGQEASRHCTSAIGHLTVYQDIPVIPATLYKASLWLKAVDVDGSGFGAAPDDSAGLHITELRSDGSVGLDHTVVAVNTATDWTQLSEEFTTQSDTATVRFMMETYIGGAWGGGSHWQHGWVTYDTTALDGPKPYVPVGTIAELKAMADESYVGITGKVVSSAFDGFFYIEEGDRTSGIKVTGTAAAGDVATVIGWLRTVDGERTLVSTSVSAAAGGTIPKPLGMNNKAVEGQSGLSGVGLYVTTWGRVDAVGGNPFTLTDGSGASLKVYAPSGYSATPSDYVKVIGALGAELSGADVVPVLRAVSVAKAD